MNKGGDFPNISQLINENKKWENLYLSGFSWLPVTENPI